MALFPSRIGPDRPQISSRALTHDFATGLGRPCHHQTAASRMLGREKNRLVKSKIPNLSFHFIKHQRNRHRCRWDWHSARILAYCNGPFLIKTNQAFSRLPPRKALPLGFRLPYWFTRPNLPHPPKCATYIFGNLVFLFEHGTCRESIVGGQWRGRVFLGYGCETERNRADEAKGGMKSRLVLHF